MKNNNVLKSFLKFVMVTALVHIGILIFKSIKEGNIKLLNYFSILDLNSIFPKIIKGWLSDLVSIVIMTSIFLAFLITGYIKKAKVEINKYNGKS